MALPTSGALSLNAIHVEAGGTSGTTASLNDSDILICTQLGKDYVIKNMYFESGSKIHAFI